MKPMYVYLVTNRPRGTLYVGVTNDLVRRVHEHRMREGRSFTARYNLDRLVHFEQFDDPENAIRREKALKKWLRQWKVDLIEQSNPAWRDLWPDITV